MIPPKLPLDPIPKQERKMLPPKQVENQKPQTATESPTRIVSPREMALRDLLVRSIYLYAKSLYDDDRFTTLSSACAEIVSRIKHSDAPPASEAVILALLKLEFQGNA